MLNAPESAARRDLPDRPRFALAEHRAARRAGHGRAAGARPGGRRLAPPAAARGGRRIVDPARPRRADARVTSVAEIVADVRARGDEARPRVVAPARRRRACARRADGGDPGARRSSSSRTRSSAGTSSNARAMFGSRCARGSSSNGAGFPLRAVGVYVPRGLVSTLVMCAVPARAAGVERIVVVTPPAGRGPRRGGREAARPRGGVGARRPAGDRGARVRDEVDPRVDKIGGPGSAYVNEAKLARLA